MIVIRSEGDGYWWHIASDKSDGVYIRLAGNNGIVLPRVQAIALSEALVEVLDAG